MPELLFVLCIALVVLYATWQIAKSFYNGIRAIVEAVLSLFRQSDWHKYLRGEGLSLERWRKQHAKYLKTPHWKKYSYNLRKKVGECQVLLCDVKDISKLHVHHTHYKSPFNEKEKDTPVLCGDEGNGHHADTHRGKTLVLKNGKKLKPFGR